MTRMMTLFAALTLVACSGDDATGDCVEAEYICTGEVLQQCTDGAYVDIEDCAAGGMVCMADMEHCMTETMTNDTSMGTM